MLCPYFYGEELKRHFTLVDASAPGVMRLQVALTDASAATLVLPTFMVVVPQARALNMVRSRGTGSYLFAGYATAEGQVIDFMSSQRLAAFVDELRVASL